jgi:ATP-dependent helicase HrpB
MPPCRRSDRMGSGRRAARCAALGVSYAAVNSPPLPDLPIKEALPALTEALARRRSVLLEAPPGAGKSTIVPLILRASPWLEGRKILMLEPRRIAARAVAGRMAHLLGEPVGRSVGFRTRLETRVSRETRIEVVTEGILTRMLQDDSSLSGIGCVIFDEFHERSLNADLGLALSIESQRNLREDLRLLVMSATLDLAPIARLLDDAPIIAARGRSFDVVTHYVARRQEIYLEQQTAQVVRTALAEHDGDVLCFLPGAAEIRRVQRALEEPGLPGVSVLPLYGDLEGAAQDAALAPAAPGRRKVVLATSIAETSLTIEGVRVVVDSGLRRYAEFDPVTGMSRLVTAKVSQAAADQRRGRAGRLSTGHCYRLWSEGTQASLVPQTAPEILHADLAPLALELSCWGAVDAGGLSWLDAPPAATLAQARDLLRQLEAIDSSARVLPHGRTLAKLGMHPRLAHMLVKSRDFGAPRLACDLAAILSERDILRASPGARDVDLASAGVRDARRGAKPAGRHHGGRSRRRPGGAQLGALAARLWTRPARHGGSARCNRNSAGLGLSGSHRPGARRRRPVPARQWPGRALRGTAGAVEGGIHRGGGTGRRGTRGADFSRGPGAARRPRAAVFGADPRAVRDSLGRARAGDPCAARAPLSVPWSWNRERYRIPTHRLCRVPRSRVSRNWASAVCRGRPELRQWQARVMLMHKYHVAAPDPWPDLSDAALDATLDEWAPPWISGFTRREHFARMDLGNALRSRLTYAQGAILEREAPTHFTVPSGSHIPIDYLDGDTPTLSVRLQEMFGLNQTPSIAAGRLPLLLKLLSPARRPVQITRDLVSFWNRGYHEVKKDSEGPVPETLLARGSLIPPSPRGAHGLVRRPASRFAPRLGLQCRCQRFDAANLEEAQPRLDERLQRPLSQSRRAAAT